jgi:putative transposase
VIKREWFLGLVERTLGHRPIADIQPYETLRWVDWFNNHRLFGPIGHIPPAEAEANYYAIKQDLDMVA